MKQAIHSFWIAKAISLLNLAAISPTQAQIAPDLTLPVNSAVGISEDNISTITGGTIAGNNLFHSFNQFKIGEGQKAYFDSPSAAIQNIMARVTGGSSSEIKGILGTSGLSKPNLFLINPNGIVFGPKASLEVGGSFVATTANTIQFGERGFFSASAPNNPRLLTVNPSAFLFNSIAARPIANQSVAGLKVNDGQSLLLVGGKLTLDKGILEAPGGRVELGGVAGSGTVGLNVDSNNLRLSFPDGVQRADVSLTNGAFINVVAGGGGSIALSAQNLDILEESYLEAGIEEGLESGGTKAGDITLDAIEAMTIANSYISNDVGFEAVGNTGGIFIKAELLSLTAAELSASTFGQGEAGDIFVQANNSVSIARSLITTGPQETGVGIGNGNGGDINIQTGALFLTDTLLDTATSNQGLAGNVTIDARNTVFLENSRISSDTFGSGNAGIIDIKARDLSLTKGAVILSSSTGKGNAGNIQINASDSVSISGVNLKEGFSTGLITATEEEDSGPGGDISVTTGTLSISDGAVLSARTRSASAGGNITVDANTLEVTDGGQLLTSTFNSGRAGNITVNASDRVTLSGSDPTYADRLDRFRPRIVDPDGPASGLFARTQGAGTAGNLKITTGQLQVLDGAEVTVSGRLGQAGNLIATADSILLENKGKLTAVTGAGDGGNIRLQDLDLLLMRRQSQISAEALNKVNGGNITIDTDLIVAIPSEDSNITANAFEGKGGFIQITAQGVFGLERREEPTPLSDITAISQQNPELNGVVEINTPDVDPSRGLVALPAQLVDVTGLIAQDCSAGGGNMGRGESEFIVTGRGGLPPQPGEALRTSAVAVNGDTLEAGVENREAEVTSMPVTHSTPAPLVEAQGWVINAKGQVVLTASAPTVTPNSSKSTVPQCHAS